MDASSLETKYQKLATEYSKVRAHASVLKRALLDEQQKSSSLVETLRQRDTSLRRLEQEVDSLGFRNKQLEHRVQALQDDLQRPVGKSNSTASILSHPADHQQQQRQQQQYNSNNQNNVATAAAAQPTSPTSQMFADELQRRINANAQLATQLADQTTEQQRLVDRCAVLEQRATRQREEHATLEHRLRKDLATMCQRVAAMETNSAAGSSDDTMSMVSDRDGGGGVSDALQLTHSTKRTNHNKQHGSRQQQQQLQLQQQCCTDDDGTATSLSSGCGDRGVAASPTACDAQKCAQLERELFQLRTQLEFQTVRDTPTEVLQEKSRALRRASNGPNGAPWTVSKREASATATVAAGTSSADTSNTLDTSTVTSTTGNEEQAVREKWILRHFSEKFDLLFAGKQEADSRTKSYVHECDNLQATMNLLEGELTEQRTFCTDVQCKLQLAEEDLATTRINYEEQISVLTEQLISLSDQLAIATS